MILLPKKILIILSFLLCAFLVTAYINFSSPDRCDCKPEDHPYRALAKHDILLKELPERKSFITTETIRSWEKKYLVDLLIEENESGRMNNTPEDTIYKLKGYLYEIKTNKADCDLHLQVGPKNPNASRVVIEIPPEKCALQDSVIAQFMRKGYKTDRQLFKGVYFEARGPAFFDGNNRGRPGKKHTAGCTWEIHPVVSFQFK